MSPAVENQHGTAILVGDRGILIRGRARSGKSSLAFCALRRAEILGLPAFLVSDDQVLLEASAGRLVARPPASLRGLIEVSGIGILPERWIPEAALSLLVDLREPEAVERLPENDAAQVMGVALPRLVLPVRQAAFGADILQGLAMRRDPAALTKS